MIDLQLIRDNGSRALVKESETKRYRDPVVVDKAYEADCEWKSVTHRRSRIARVSNIINKTIGKKMKAKEFFKGEIDELLKVICQGKLDDMTDEDAQRLTVSQLKNFAREINDLKARLEQREAELVIIRDSCMSMIGNVLHHDVPVSTTEDNNLLIETKTVHNSISTGQSLFPHDVLLKRIGGMDMKAGSVVAGNRGYYLVGPAVYLAQALINTALKILGSKNYIPVQPPYFMSYEMLDRASQLNDFDDRQYRITKGYDDTDSDVPDDNDLYLIATSEQPLTAFNYNKKISKNKLPIKYAGLSTCFRTEASRHGEDTHGIFRVHQFDKVEQFVLCSPDPKSENNSQVMMDEMIDNCKEFLDALNISYRIVSIVSKELNLSASIKYDIEGLFYSASDGTRYRELVSCSNCTDYQARSMETKYDGEDYKYVYMLNSTMCAVTRMICAVLESNQTVEGIQVPKILKPYMPTQYEDMIPYVE